jgi:hypothetical protein
MHLVVRGTPRSLSDEAIANIVAECQGLGVNVGASARDFVAAQLAAARTFALDALPIDS